MPVRRFVVEIPLAGLILDVRNRVVETKGLNPIKKAVFALYELIPVSLACSRVLPALGIFRSPLVATTSCTQLRSPGASAFYTIGGELASGRRLPPLQSGRCAIGWMRKSGWWGRASERADLKVCDFAGCMTDRLYPEMGEAVIKVLESVGVQVVFPKAQNCCGLPSLNSEDRRGGMVMAKQTIVALENALDENQVRLYSQCVHQLCCDRCAGLYPPVRGSAL